jgi:hypothetical protein
LAHQENNWFEPEQFLQSKRQGTRSTKPLVGLPKPNQGGNYGIPDFNWCRLDDGAVRANHSGLSKATRMVTANRNEGVINMHTLSTPLSKEEKHAHNEIAAVLSIVPGLGHIYKGHYEMGLFLMFVGMPMAIFVGIISILGTAGVGLLFPIGCWAALAYDAYRKKDRRHHHHLTSEADDESPD